MTDALREMMEMVLLDPNAQRILAGAQRFQREGAEAAFMKAGATQEQAVLLAMSLAVGVSSVLEAAKEKDKKRLEEGKENNPNFVILALEVQADKADDSLEVSICRLTSKLTEKDMEALAPYTQDGAVDLFAKNTDLDPRMAKTAGIIFTLGVGFVAAHKLRHIIQDLKGESGERGETTEEPERAEGQDQPDQEGAGGQVPPQAGRPEDEGGNGKASDRERPGG